jgi:hypothetical protein
MGFLDFLNKIKQDFVLLIDEFEKIFPNNNNSKGRRLLLPRINS